MIRLGKNWGGFFFIITYVKTLQEILADKPVVNRQRILDLISFIDLTTLDNCDTTGSVSDLIQKANRGFNGIHPAAVCTFSTFGNQLRNTLNKNIKAAVVGGCFPSGQTLSSVKIEEVRLIALEPVDEIDVVLNRGDFLAENYDAIRNELAGMKKVAGTKKLKVILETGDLNTSDQIKKAAELALESGADFIKTSTGKTAVGATPEAVYTMCACIKDHYNKTGVMVGIKPSGGIRTLEDALVYYQIIFSVLGEAWLTQALFRIGASSLYDNLILAYENYEG